MWCFGSQLPLFSSGDFGSHPLTLLLSAFALLLYASFAKRIRRLPKLPTGWLLLYLALNAAEDFLPPSWEEMFAMPIGIAATIALFCALARILFAVTVETWFALRRQMEVPRITRDLAMFVAYAAIVLVVLRTKGGVNLVGLITTSAVLTAVIGLAAQNFLGNLFSGLAIQAIGPFRIGDWIESGGHQGKVVHIGWEATHLLTFDEELVIVPNLDIAKSVVTNRSRPTIRHCMKIDVGVEYGAAPAAVRSALLEVCRREPGVLTDPPPVVRLMEYGDFAVTYRLRAFYNDFGASPELRGVLMDRIWYALRREGIRIPYPIRDVQHRHVERRHEAVVARELRARAEANLAGIPILEPLPAESRALLAAKLAIQDYGDGEIIVAQGDPGDSLYIIHRGSCSVEIQTASRPPERVASLAPSAFFGEMSLLTGEPRSATVRAAGETTVFAIGKILFREVLAAHPEISGALAAALAARQAETGGVRDRQREEAERLAGSLLVRIKKFFLL